ncbi:MAG: metallophosphoesterase [Clostridia bacterium]|nr:metallophosphoesterase [Clostridia bacterium]
MRILHTGDVHLSELPGPVTSGRNARMQDTLNCMARVITIANDERPDAIVIAGDLFHRSKMWADPMLEQIRLAANWLRELGAIAPTVLLFGTANHDNPAAFNTINNMRITGLRVSTSPELITLATKSGELQVACVPGLDKGHFRVLNPGMDPADENVQCSKLLGDIVLGLSAQLDTSLPSVLVAHYAVAGCEYDNGQTHIFNQSEVTLPTEALAASAFDLVCLGHIHRMQAVVGLGGKPVFYCGSLNRITFNDAGWSKGFFIHDLSNPGEPAWFSVPARQFSTVYAFQDTLYNWPAMFADDPAAALETYSAEIDPVKDAIVRVHYRCDEDIRKRMNHKAIEKALYDAGAFWVSEIKPVQITTALSKQEMTETAGPAENLAAWLLAEGFDAEETQALVDLARPLIEQVSARQPTGKLSGLFVPRRVEVRNYRSYKEAAFDFDPITFATVNGPNGVGKSALFMDAVSDCLYEEPREGDLTGWISNDEAARSGSITFEFLMGDSAWKVVRTRAKSGKTTLALQELVDGQWVDRSADKVKDTQEKIVTLLGMDALTFRCCGLIMQDAYGLFLEADREDRMSVLGNILGLGVYEDLEKLAKERATEVNRELTAAKAKLAELDERLKERSVIEPKLDAARAELESTSKLIAAREAELTAVEAHVRTLEAKRERAEQLESRIQELSTESATITAKMTTETARRDSAQKLLDQEPRILAKAQEYEQTKERIAVLKAKQPRLTEIRTEFERVDSEASQASAQVEKLLPQITALQDALANRAELESAADGYRRLSVELEQMDGLFDQKQVFVNQVREIEKTTDRRGEDKRALKGASENLRSTLEFLRSKSAMLTDSNCLDPERAACRFLADAIEAKAQIPKVEGQVTGIENQMAAIDTELAPLFDQIIGLEAQEADLGYDSERHYELMQSVKQLRPRAEQAAQLEAKAELLVSLREQRNQALGTQGKALERIKALNEEAKLLKAELQPLAELETALPQLEGWIKSKEQLPVAREIVATATATLAEFKHRMKQIDAQLQDLQAEQNQLKIASADLESSRQNVTNLHGFIKSKQGFLSDIHARIGGCQVQLEVLDKYAEERRRLAEDMEPLAQSVVRYQTLTRAFGQDGIPFAVVRAVVPELAAMSNEILGQMTGGKMGLEMRTERIQKSNKKEVNTLEIWILDYVRGALPYKSRSGGQRVKAALSVAFALADLKARRAGIQLGMIFADEPPHLDSEGVDAYCDALELMSQRYAGMKVIAISHDPRMKARFPQIIEVEDGGEEGSRVKLIA